MSDFPIINPQKHLFSFMWIYQRNNRLGINIKKIWEFFSCIDFIWASLKDLTLCVCSLNPEELQKRLRTWDILKNKTYIVSLIRYIT